MDIMLISSHMRSRAGGKRRAGEDIMSDEGQETGCL